MHGLLAFRPAVAPAIKALTETLLRSEEGLNRGERELIGAFVSALNDCTICRYVHGAVAQCHLKVDADFIEQVNRDFFAAPVSEKMKALLAIAQSTQQGGSFVRDEQVRMAKAAGATDLEIHDTVLISALFCLFNRYLDGLGVLPDDTPETCQQRGRMIAEKGYL